MTRGKHGQSAAARQAIQQAETEAAGVRREVERLAAENRDLKARLEAQSRAHAAEMKVLKAAADDAATPTVQRLEAEVIAQKGRADAAVEDHERIKKHWEKLLVNLADHLNATYGFKGIESMETLLNVMMAGEHGEKILTDAVIHGKNLDENAIRTLSRLRGERG